MSIAVFETIKGALFGITGDYTVIALGFLVFFLVVFLMVGLEFRFALMLVAPLAIAFSFGGWFSPFVSFMFWFVIVGLGIFLMVRAYEGY